jgi:hypothetical protein
VRLGRGGVRHMQEFASFVVTNPRSGARTRVARRAHRRTRRRAPTPHQTLRTLPDVVQATVTEHIRRTAERLTAHEALHAFLDRQRQDDVDGVRRLAVTRGLVGEAVVVAEVPASSASAQNSPSTPMTSGGQPARMSPAARCASAWRTWSTAGSGASATSSASVNAASFSGSSSASRSDRSGSGTPRLSCTIKLAEPSRPGTVRIVS